MSKIDHRDEPELLFWNTKYNGSAIYKLIDQDGKVYIGQTKHLQNRMKAHKAAFKKIHKATSQELEEKYMGVGKKMVDAIRKGKVFHMEVLKTFTEVYEASKKDLDYWEDYYLRLYGGVENTYNVDPICYSNSTYPPYLRSISWEEYAKQQAE